MTIRKTLEIRGSGGMSLPGKFSYSEIATEAICLAICLDINLLLL